MAGWGTGSFENEDAQSFLKQLSHLAVDGLWDILSRAADHDDYLNASESSVIVTAAEIVATAKGAPPSTVPCEVSEWVGRIEGTPSHETNDLARRAVERVRLNSELKDLWLQADGLNEWSANLRDLEQRLASQVCS